jgi:hypothetical protein
MTHGYLPRNIEKLIAWGTSFFVYLEANLAKWPVPGDWEKAVRDSFDALEAAYEKWSNPATQTKATHADMEAKRGLFEKAVEPLVQMLKSLPMLTPYDFEMLQIPAPGDRPYPRIGKPKTWPVLQMTVIGHGSVEFSYRDVETPDVTARPHGVSYAIVRMGFSEKENPSIDDLTYTPLVMTRTPQRRLFPPDCIGLTLHAISAWVNPTGEQGPWSTMVKVVVY